jgi:hypothetical protein
LGGVTEIGSFLFFVAPPKVAKASTILSVMCHCCKHFCLKTSPMYTSLKEGCFVAKVKNTFNI